MALWGTLGSMASQAVGATCHAVGIWILSEAQQLVRPGLLPFPGEEDRS